MPARFVPYLVGLVQGVLVSATSLERQFGYSHDGITRTLVHRCRWDHWIFLIIQRLFGILSGGDLLLDDTVIAKPYARHMEGASFVHSSVLNKTVYGYNVVFLCWSNGTITLPLAWKWYRANSKTKIDLALELLATAKRRWKITPRYVLFEKFYGADRVLNTLHAYHWKFVTQLKCTGLSMRHRSRKISLTMAIPPSDG